MHPGTLCSSNDSDLVQLILQHFICSQCIKMTKGVDWLRRCWEHPERVWIFCCYFCTFPCLRNKDHIVVLMRFVVSSQTNNNKVSLHCLCKRDTWLKCITDTGEKHKSYSSFIIMELLNKTCIGITHYHSILTRIFIFLMYNILYKKVKYLLTFFSHFIHFSHKLKDKYNRRT